jgi:hypothetical protein
MCQISFFRSFANGYK